MNDIQKIILDIFKTVSSIADEHHISYYAIGGTCLGAVRHQGFIPWDDDIDIAVPVEDYEPFLEILSRELPEHYTIRFIESTDHYGNVFAKIIDERTTMIEMLEYDYPDAYKGVFLDIMQLSGMPSNSIARKFFCQKVNLYRILNEMRRFDIKDLDLAWKKKIWPVFRMFDRLIPVDYFAKKWFTLLKRYPFQNCKYTGYVCGYEVLSLTYPIEVFGKPTPMEFEDTIMYCPEQWDRLLTKQFGDYMSPPPESKQKPTHKGTIDLKHSYHDYQKGLFQLSPLQNNEQ